MKMFPRPSASSRLYHTTGALRQNRASPAARWQHFPLWGFYSVGRLSSPTPSSQHMSERLVNIVMITALFVITGGLHIDGFMDTVDGLAGGRTKEDVLRIMRDSHVGALGVVGVCLLVLVKWEALNSMESGSKNAALFIMPVVGRWG